MKPPSERKLELWTPTEAGVDRIIDAGKSRRKPNRDRLVNALLLAWNKWLTFTALDSNQAAHERRELFALIAEAGKGLKKALLDPRGDYYAGRQVASSFTGFETFLSGLDRIIKAAEDAEKSSRKPGGRLTRSPPEWFAVEIL